MQSPGTPQLQLHGAQTESLSQATAGQAQAQGGGSVGAVGRLWQTPERQLSPAGQARPSPYHTQAALALQVVASSRLAQGSVTTCTQAPEAPHSQGGQVWPAGQLGHAQAPMPYQSQPLVVSPVQLVASACAVQGSVGAGPASHEQGAQGSPALQAGQVQFRVPSDGALPVPEP